MSPPCRVLGYRGLWIGKIGPKLRILGWGLYLTLFLARPVQYSLQVSLMVCQDPQVDADRRPGLDGDVHVQGNVPGAAEVQRPAFQGRRSYQDAHSHRWASQESWGGIHQSLLVSILNR
jgi:hypothetical protein